MNVTMLVTASIFVLFICSLFCIAGYIAFWSNAIKPNADVLATFKKWRDRIGTTKLTLLIVGYFTSVLYGYYLLILIWGPLALLFVVGTANWLILFTFFQWLGKHVSRRQILQAGCGIIGATLVTSGWIFFPNWLTIDIATFLLAIWLLVHCRNITLTEIFIISTAVLIYDVINVFGTGIIQEVASAATKINIPLLLIAPNSLSLESSRVLALGLGDVVLPGIVVMLALRETHHHKLSSIAAFTLVGYILGFFVTVTIHKFFEAPQPATIYLIPGVFLGFLGTAYFKGILKRGMNLTPPIQ